LVDDRLRALPIRSWPFVDYSVAAPIAAVVEALVYPPQEMSIGC
jgi:hypothetical protein